jgi:hypothetical protein
LNNVFGARLHITALRGAAGPGVEFLEYLNPRNGRPASGIESNDLAHWETTVATTDADTAFARLLQARVLFVSPSIATLTGQNVVRSLLVRDPDGHAVKVTQR